MAAKYTEDRPVSPHACDIIYTALNSRITIDAELLNEVMHAIHAECIDRDRRLVVGQTSVFTTATKKEQKK